jgi:outer membrane protein TolC
MAAMIHFSAGAQSAETSPMPKPAVGSSPAPQRTTLQLGLAEALDRAYANSMDLRRLREEVAEARAVRDGSLSDFLPTIEVFARAGTAKDKDPTQAEPQVDVPRERNFYAGGLTLRQSIFRGFVDLSEHRAASARIQQKESELAARQSALRREVIEDYFAIQLDLARIQAEEEVQTANQEQLEVAQNRFRAGSVTEVDVLRARYAVEAQRPVIAGLIRDVAKKKLKFAHALGLPLDQPFHLQVSLGQSYQVVERTQLPPVSEAFATALGSNEQVRSLRLDQDLLDFENAKVRGSHWPQLDFVASAETRADQRADIGSPDAERLSAQIEIKMPIFTGFSSFSQRHGSAARSQALAAKFEALKQSILQDLTDHYRSLELSLLRTKSAQTNVELAQKTVARSEAQYRAGRITMTEVLNSYAELLTARKDFAQAMFDGISASARIQEMTGGGLQISDKVGS